MPVFAFIFVLQICAIVQASKQRNVNLALETVLEFENDDDLKFIDTVQSFLDKIKGSMDRKRATDNKRREFSRQGEGALTFTRFLADIITTLQTYKDEDLEKFFITLEKETRNWQNQNNILKETDKVGFRRLISSKLERLKNAPAQDIRRKLSSFSKRLHHGKSNQNADFIADFLNHLYRKESQRKLTRFLNNLKIYRSQTRRSKDMNLQQIIRSGLKTIFKPISLLNMKVSNDEQSVKQNRNQDKSDSRQTDYDLFEDIKKNLKKIPKILHDIEKAKAGVEENEIFDYIEDRKKVIEKHIKTGYKPTSKKKERKKLANASRYSEATKNKKKSKPKYNSEESKRNFSEEKKYKTDSSKSNDKSQTNKDSTETDGSRGLSELQEPILITIVSSNETDSRSEKDDMSTQPTKQRRYKKFTRRLITRKNIYHLKTTTKRSHSTTKKGRKAFFSTIASDEGLSIEDVRTRLYLYPKRKRNDNDTFSQIVTHTTSPYDPKHAHNKNQTTGKNKGKEPSKDGRNIMNSTLEEKTEDGNEIISENIRLSGDIQFESPTIRSQNEITVKTTTPKFKHDVLKQVEVNVTSTTTIQLHDIKPTIVLRSNDFSETNLTTETPSIEFFKPTKTRTTGSSSKTEAVTRNEDSEISTKTVDDGLEDELESIMKKYNTSSTNSDLDNFFKENETDGTSNKVKNQMKADLEKLFALPTISTNADVQTFTDPFKEIDEAIDLF